MVTGQALAAVKAGVDGLMIAASAKPEKALVDGRQTLNIPEFVSLVKQIKKLKIL